MSKPKMTVLSMGVPCEMLQQIRELAHRKSLQDSREIRWTTLVREAIARTLDEAKASGIFDDQ